MKKCLFVAVGLCAVLASIVRPAGAFPVIDVANLIQNTLAAIQQITEIEHQVEQISNQAQSLANEAKNLASLPYSVVAQLHAATEEVNRLLRQANGIAYDVQHSIEAFEQLYPESYATSISNNQLAADTLQRWHTSLQALQTTIRVQSQAVQNFASDESALTELVSRSQSADGALQVAQVTNQLLALHARQMIQEQQLRVAQDRASALEQARAVAATERAAVVRQKFMTDRTRYTPAASSF